MVKLFYTLNEAKAVLGRSDEEIAALVCAGKLREFRDGAQPMFRSEQVEALKIEITSHYGAQFITTGPESLSRRLIGNIGAIRQLRRTNA